MPPDKKKKKSHLWTWLLNQFRLVSLIRPHWSLLISQGSKTYFAPSVAFPWRVGCGNLKETLSVPDGKPHNNLSLSQCGPLALEKERVFLSVHGKQEVDWDIVQKEGGSCTNCAFKCSVLMFLCRETLNRKCLYTSFIQLWITDLYKKALS